MRRLALLVACLFCALPATASPILWQLSGSVTGTSPSAGAAAIEASGITVGTPLEFLITLPDVAVPDFCPQDGQAIFFSAGTAAVTVLGQTYAGSLGGLEVNATSGGCFPTAGFPGATSAFYVARLLLAGPFPNATLTWVSSGIDPDVFPFAIPGGTTLGLSYNCGVCGNDMTGTLTTVPEPTTLLLLGPPFGLACWRRYRRH